MSTLQSELARITGTDWTPAPERDYNPARNRATSYQGDVTPEVVEKVLPTRTYKERAYRQWSQHSVDMGSFYHGKRKATRGTARTLSVGMALELAKHTTRENFIRGKGLVRSKGKYALYVEGLRRGYLDDINKALAWAKAATSHGLHGQCIEE